MPNTHQPFEWFSDWVEQHLLLTLTVVSIPDPVRVLAAFGPTDFDRSTLSLQSAYDLDRPSMRLGTAAEWSYAVEHASTTGGDSRVLARLTADGGTAVSLCFTPNISGVHVARDGDYLCGFEPASPDWMRWGSAPHAFDAEIQAAGFPGSLPTPGAPAASFLHLLTGVTLTPAMLEDPLPCATMPGHTGTGDGSPRGAAPLVPGTLMPDPTRQGGPSDR
ncbi:DUF6461 domain-containing protein [Modestobacter roseus]|uniref:Uncharacterized protein n=1 Tax=Modestobacter roseus TaxID=1181884 RepID=A0A562ILB0_9ACTN|nr:DUF6461 domain-containing protein [Modestobacter roseus]MQA32235.1 hypothetical protein [Modestobacter roseus]TWH71730.1 hypothetical protein JD78_00228 [Modestobacter roseus]